MFYLGSLHYASGESAMTQLSHRSSNKPRQSERTDGSSCSIFRLGQRPRRAYRCGLFGVQQLLTRGCSDPPFWISGNLPQDLVRGQGSSQFLPSCLAVSFLLGSEQWFETLQQARSAINTRRQDYNEVRPHRSVGRMSPARFAELNRQRAGDSAPSSTTPESN